MSDFWDMSLTLKDSVDWGLSNIETLSEGGDYFLFDGSDSTSLMGAYPPHISPYKVEYPTAYSDLFPVARTMYPYLFDKAINKSPLNLD